MASPLTCYDTLVGAYFLYSPSDGYISPPEGVDASVPWSTCAHFSDFPEHCGAVDNANTFAVEGTGLRAPTLV